MSEITALQWGELDTECRHLLVQRSIVNGRVPYPTCGVATGEWCTQSQPTANGKRVVIHNLRKEAAGKFGDIGWHTFRHPYRS